MAWLSGWSKRIKLTIDSGKVDDALAYFPVLVYLSGSSGIGGTDVSAVFDEIGSNSLKFAITLSDGTTQCYVEIEKWDSANEKAWLWVRVPSISASANTDLYLYYDNEHADNSTYVGAIGSTPGQNVWDSNFMFVCHMRDNTTSSVLDSTSNGHNGSKGAANEPIQAEAKISDGQDFDGSNDAITIANHADFDFSAGFTLEHIVKSDTDTDSFRGTYRYDASSQDGYWLGGHYTSTPIRHAFYTYVNGVSQRVFSDNAIDTENHAHVAGVRDGSGNMSMYVNGSVQTDTNTNAGAIDSSGVLFIGCDYVFAHFLNGLLDEVRISNTNRSAAWIKATYHTCWDSLITFGSEETVPADIELAIPAFVSSADLLSTISLQLSVPPMTGQGMLYMNKIFFGRFIQCDPFSSVASLTGKLAINLAPPVLASQSMLKGNVEFQLLIPVFSGIGILSLSDLFIGNFISAPAFEATGSMNCDLDFQIKIPALAGHGALLVTPCVQLSLDLFGAVASLHMASVNKFNIESAEIYYTFVLTGKDDGISDITIPISSFQARLRSGDPTYLSVVVPGMDHAGAISARPNGEMIIYMHYYSGGLLLQTEEIIRANLEDINTSKGAKSRSIVLTGHRTTTTGGKNVTLRNPTYRNLYRGKFTYRCATPDIFLRPGDTVICGDDTFDVVLITYVVSIAQQSMEITGT